MRRPRFFSAVICKTVLSLSLPPSFFLSLLSCLAPTLSFSFLSRFPACLYGNKALSDRNILMQAGRLEIGQCWDHIGDFKARWSLPHYKAILYSKRGLTGPRYPIVCESWWLAHSSKLIQDCPFHWYITGCLIGYDSVVFISCAAPGKKAALPSALLSQWVMPAYRTSIIELRQARLLLLQPA